ncbi:hypothetical protein [Streptomyces sp. NPDC052496]|uniref:hypothetical protein n=1 Tax=Streptomyces sp. NPDC052496 TaxID=3154951 RepID=UPI00342E6E54
MISERPAPTDKSARRLAMEEARRSKRPSRSDRRAGTTAAPDRVLDGGGFDELLRTTLRRARAADDITTLIDTLITLDGHLAAEHAWRSATREEAAAVRVLTRPGRSAGRTGGLVAHDKPAPDAVFTSALSLTPQGRLAITLPGHRALPAAAAALGVAARVSWSADDLAEYQRLLPEADRLAKFEVHECRSLLSELGTEGRAKAVGTLRSAVFLVPPVQLYQGGNVYSNLRDDGNLTGKTLLPTHPDCFFHHLDRLPLNLWSDEEAVVVTCLWLLHSSGGPNRIESFNGYQLSLENVAQNFREMRDTYLEADADAPVDPVPAGTLTVAELLATAAQLAKARAVLVGNRRLYYEIDASTRRKTERALPRTERPSPQESGVCARLSELLPAPGDFADLLKGLRAEREWLHEPRSGYPTGFEALIHTTVRTSAELFAADFAMSRGIRSLPKLIDALGREDWAEIVSWELPEFYCCVVPGPSARSLYDGDRTQLADSAWAMSARMQYNTWHVMPGNLPKDPAVQSRDFLAPHALPDLAYHSHLHHRGHVTNDIRFSARSPEKVLVAGFPFVSLTDLRVLRCQGKPFGQADLLAVTRIARFLAQVSELVAEAAEAGLPTEVTAFDHHWHRKSITENEEECHVRAG